MTSKEKKPIITETFDEYEIMVERLRRIDKKEYLDENEHRFILESIKACFRETIHQRDYIKQLESKIKEYENLMGTPIQDIMKRLKVLEILKKSANESGMRDYHFDYYTFLVARNSEDYKLIEDWWWLENDK